MLSPEQVRADMLRARVQVRDPGGFPGFVDDVLDHAPIDREHRVCRLVARR